MDNKKLIFVMGVQRSGTTALFNSLASDPGIASYDESIDSDLFSKFFLKPESEIREFLQNHPGPVLLKPISETKYRSIDDLVDEFNRYDLKIIWIYRDPVNVFYSWCGMKWLTINLQQANYFSSVWNQWNQRLLDGLSVNNVSILVLKYEDLISSSSSFDRLCRILGVEGRFLFRKDSRLGRKNLPAEIIRKIDVDTFSTLSQLNRSRSFLPQGIINQIKSFSFKAVLINFGVNLRVRKIRIADQIRNLIKNYSNQVIYLWKKNSLQTKTMLVKLNDTRYGQTNPETIPGLHFWISADNISRQNSSNRITIWEDIGPYKIHSKGELNGILHVPEVLNGKPAVHFTGNGGEVENKPTFLEFGSEINWRLTFDGSPFTLMILFQPQYIPMHNSIKRSIVLATGTSRGPGFAIIWDPMSSLSVGIIAPRLEDKMVGMDQSVLAAVTPRDSHPSGNWKFLACVHNQNENQHNMMLFSDYNSEIYGIKNPNIDYDRVNQSDCGLCLGGIPDSKELNFNGYFAELIIFSKALPKSDIKGVRNYLFKKYTM